MAAKEAAAVAEPKKKSATPKVDAESMATRQRDISVSEFFAKNRHLLGFDNPRKAMLTTIKEAVDNSLDACEEAGILPEIAVIIEDLEPTRPASAKSSRYRGRWLTMVLALFASRSRTSLAACCTDRSFTD